MKFIQEGWKNLIFPKEMNLGHWSCSVQKDLDVLGACLHTQCHGLLFVL